GAGPREHTRGAGVYFIATVSRLVCALCGRPLDVAGGLANMCPYEGEARAAVHGSEEAADEEEAAGRAVCRAAPEAGRAGRAASGACDGAVGGGAAESAREGDVRGRARVSSEGEGAAGGAGGPLRGTRKPRSSDRRGGGEIGRDTSELQSRENLVCRLLLE